MLAGQLLRLPKVFLGFLRDYPRLVPASPALRRLRLEDRNHPTAGKDRCTDENIDPHRSIGCVHKLILPKPAKRFPANGDLCPSGRTAICRERVYMSAALWS